MTILPSSRMSCHDNEGPICAFDEDSTVLLPSHLTLERPRIGLHFPLSSREGPLLPSSSSHTTSKAKQPSDPKRNLAVEEAVRNQSAKVIQRFFLCVIQASRKETEQRRRLEVIEQQKQEDLDRIAELKERRKIELLLEMGMESRGELAEEIQHSEQVLQESREIIEELTRDIKVIKKENAFLQKRCKALRMKRKQLKLERKQQSKLERGARSDSRKFQECQVILHHYQSRVSEEQARLAVVEGELQTSKGRNRKLRQLMGQMVQMVEEQEPEHNDKWDLVDQLYQIQRDTLARQKRRSYNAPVVCWGRSPSSRSLPLEFQPALADENGPTKLPTLPLLTTGVATQ